MPGRRIETFLFGGPISVSRKGFQSAAAWGTLQKKRGIGDGTIHRVKQMPRSGTCDDLEALRAELPGVRHALADPTGRLPGGAGAGRRSSTRRWGVFR